MSWRSGLAAVTVIAAAVVTGLTGCGFHPLYGDSGSGSALEPDLASVHVMQIADRTGQEMTNTLRDSFNPNRLDVKEAYELDISLNTRKSDLMTRENATAARTDISLTATWALRRISDKTVVAHGSETSTTGFDVLDNEYANVVSQQATTTRAVRDVSLQIQDRVALYFRHPA